MPGFFYNLGRKAAPHILKAKWIGSSLVGSEEEKAEAERKMGGYLAHLFEQEVTVETDRKSCELLGRIAERLASRLRSSHLRFRVRCMHYPETNALAFPGGFVYVSSSLLELCRYDEDSVAFLLAHEFAHVVRGHAARRFLTDAVIKILSSRPIGRSPATRAISGMLTRLLQTSYSQNQELEADLFAVNLTASARYAPEAGIRLFHTLDSQSEEPSLLSGFFSSHPAFDIRIEALRQEWRRITAGG